MNLVADCRDTVAPKSRGCWFNGVAKVLSTATIAPGLRGAAQTASRSATVSSGFEGDSSQIRSATPQERIQPAVSSTATRCTDQRFLSARGCEARDTLIAVVGEYHDGASRELIEHRGDGGHPGGERHGPAGL